uniref:Heavy metal-binding protein HIP-like isoform X1 n=1 Tax=Crassostrea virginica TaxID=6565 RepID=A0A8B8BED7_CRAVI|nr:heavy metal-binding protein HIP-like isoform X1 [Crassostrea virginica]
MIAHFCVLALFFAPFGTAESNSNGCISREEFEKFKTDVLNRIELLTVEKNQQIEDQKKTILDLKSLLARFDDTSPISVHHEDLENNSTEDIPLHVSEDASSEPLPVRRLAPMKRLSSAAIRAPEDVIAFSAFLTNKEINPGAHHIIVYDHVLTNSGNGYSKHTGAFVAPRAGFYVFSWTTFANPGSYFPIELTVNSARAGIVFVQGDTTYNGVTGVAVVQLQQSDAVMVRSEPGYTPHGDIYSEHNMQTSFSGWCISC